MSLMTLLHLDWLLGRPMADIAEENVPVDLSQLVMRAAGAIRRGDIDLAEWLLAEHGAAVRKSAPCLNLLGVIALAEGNWSKAKSLWGRAARIDWSYKPAQNNLRRYFELATLGRSQLPLVLGDEPIFAPVRQEKCL